MMKKVLLYIGTLSCLFLGCSSDDASNGSDGSDGSHPSDTLISAKSEMTLYYDIPGKMKLTYQPEKELKIVESNNCVTILTDPLVTNSKGVVYLEMVAKVFTCDVGRTIKVCDAQNEEMCTEFTVRTTAKDDEIDTNKNLMIDVYETNTDKDTYTEYIPNDCSSFCHSDADCDDFCDSAIGFKCSTRCTSDDQCIRFKDNNTWVSMKCREDGRCAYPYFKAVYNIGKDNTTLTLGGKPVDENATIDWGDGTTEPIPVTTNNNLSHTYQTKGQYKILLTGDYLNWNAGCADDIELFDIYQFGSVGLGYDESTDHGAFWNCFSFNKISAKDIPDASKLTNMTHMFGGNNVMSFDHSEITRWDTSNVTVMNMTFLNAGAYDWNGKTGFNQDIGRWNTSKVKSMNGTFYCAQMFNQPIGCWDLSGVKDISNLFGFNGSFAQNVENWNLSKVIKHDSVFTKDGSKVLKSGQIWDISLKTYCTISNKLHREDIGRHSHQCWQGVTYSGACNNDAWKKKYENCEENLKAKYPDITEDIVTCRHLRDNC